MTQLTGLGGRLGARDDGGGGPGFGLDPTPLVPSRDVWAWVEDFGAFGKGALDVLLRIVEVAFGEPGQVAEWNLFKWKAAQHIGVYVARSVVEAHDENARRMRDLALEVLLARYGRGGPSDELLEEARRGVADPRGPDARAQGPPRPHSTRYAPQGGRRPRFVRGGAPSADSRPNKLYSGAFDDSLSVASHLSGLGGRLGAGTGGGEGREGGGSSRADSRPENLSSGAIDDRLRGVTHLTGLGGRPGAGTTGEETRASA